MEIFDNVNERDDSIRNTKFHGKGFLIENMRQKTLMEANICNESCGFEIIKKL